MSTIANKLISISLALKVPPFNQSDQSARTDWRKKAEFWKCDTCPQWNKLILCFLLVAICGTASSQDSSDAPHTIIVHPGRSKPPVLLYSASLRADVTLREQVVEQSVALQLRIIQGTTGTVRLGLSGDGDVIDVQGESIAAWAVRTSGPERFLDLQIAPRSLEPAGTPDAELQPPITPTDDASQSDDMHSLDTGTENNLVSVSIRLRSEHSELPTEVELLHLTPGSAMGFDAQIHISESREFAIKILNAEGFAPLLTDTKATRLQTATGGLLQLRLDRHSALPPPIELIDATLKGRVHENGKSIEFQFQALAKVSKSNARLPILSGKMAISKLPSSSDYRLVLSDSKDQSDYELVIARAGEIQIDLAFEALIRTDSENWQSADFAVIAGAVVPMSLDGLGAELEFSNSSQSMTLLQEGGQWKGFLPATGHARLRWRNAQSTSQGKLFFTTSAEIQASVGPGLLRQVHRLKYHVLQGQLRVLTLRLSGPGEILGVEGKHVVGWEVSDNETERIMKVTLNQSVTGISELIVHSQSGLGEFPTSVEGLCLQPQEAIRHSGFLYIGNSGSVRIEPTNLRGLTQVASATIPESSSGNNQAFAYRFPSEDYGFSIQADRVQPEVNVAQLVVYQLSEADQVILADFELDIRQAPIRQWNILVPEDYSVVSVTGAGVAEYMAATDSDEGLRNLKILFNQELVGRQLISLRLEKNTIAAAGAWSLSRIQFPEAKSVRGDIGVAVAPGYRAAVSTTDLLVEKPLSYFPKTVPHLQHAFRMREPEWTAVMEISLLDRSIQSDAFHLVSLSQGTVYGSALINYIVTGAPVSEWQLTVPVSLANLTVDGQDIRSWRREGDTLFVALHQPVIGAYTLLLTFENKPNPADGSFQVGLVEPQAVQGEQGYIEVVSPVQVEMKTLSATSPLLVLDPLELPAEFRLMSSAPALGTWQYTERPFDLRLKVNWFEPGETTTQVVEYSEANSRVSADGELVTDVLYYVKSRGQQALRLKLPKEPVRLWAASVGGSPVSARLSGDETLIPLPGNADPNSPVEVRLRLGKPAADPNQAVLVLPTVLAPVLKTQWNIVSDENHLLLPYSGVLQPVSPVFWPNGFDWLAARWFIPLAVVVGLSVVSLFCAHAAMGIRLFGLLIALAAVSISVAACWDAWKQIKPPAPLQMSLPVLASGQNVELTVQNLPSWRAAIVWPGIAMLLVGVGVLLFAWQRSERNTWLNCIAFTFIAAGTLLQAGGATWFFALVALSIFIVQFLIEAADCWSTWQMKSPVQSSPTTPPSPGTEGSSAAISSLLFVLAGTTAAIMNLTCGGQCAIAAEALDQEISKPIETVVADEAGSEVYRAADSLTEQWIVSSRNQRLTATAQIQLTGRPGDRFIILQAPGVVTDFQGSGLRLHKQELPTYGLTYLATLQGSDTDDTTSQQSEEKQYTATLRYQLSAIQPSIGVAVLTGRATTHQIELEYDEPNWEVVCEAAVRIEMLPPLNASNGDPESANNTDSSSTSNPQAGSPTAKARLLLGQGEADIVLQPPARDLANELTQFFVESAGVYVPAPGVVDGKHRFSIRASQGRVQQLNMIIPSEMTVSSVDGPVEFWQFDADKSSLQLQIQANASTEFSFTVETQRSLEALPTSAKLQPLRVIGAQQEVGLLAVAFGAEAQPESVQTESLTPVNVGDFDSQLLPNTETVLYQVYRHGAQGGNLVIQIASVASEVRVESKQVLSFGDERIVLGVNAIAEITRTGLFQLSFPLPTGLEVESLSGPSLHHWSELTDAGQRQIVLHLNGKTIGIHQFSLTLAGAAPLDEKEWTVPRFELNEAKRQSGELAVQPSTGIRLRTLSRQNVSETDPRSVGAQAQGALAFRILQKDWSLKLGVDKLEAWITGQVLHEVNLREGQTRSTLMAEFNVQNAAVRSLTLRLPTSNEDEIRTVRATGEAVSDFVRSTQDASLWELRFKRRVIGSIPFQIEYQRRGERSEGGEAITPVDFPESRQMAYYFAVRTGGRLEVEPGELSAGWQGLDWNSIPQSLREAGNRNSPGLALRAFAPTNPLQLRVVRHSLAESLKLRVATGTLTTILSPTGDQLTAVDLTMEVIQRSNLSVQLPAGSEVFSIFVNGESVHSIRQTQTDNGWQFYILPGMDDRTAQVRLVYSQSGSGLKRLQLLSPQLNVPLENIQWNVIAPHGFELIDNHGNLELVGKDNHPVYDLQSYLSISKGKQQDQAQQATELLERANQLLQTGEQSKARWALNNLANRYALDAASNEDARVQLENLQTQQAVVGLNTRRQRLFLDNSRGGAAAVENEQLKQAASANPILQQEQLNYRPQEVSQLLAGNTQQDNAILQQIAGRLVQHQRSTEPAPQAIQISLPEEGSVYSFRRAVQVAENAPLELNLLFHSRYQLQVWQWALLAGLILALTTTLSRTAPWVSSIRKLHRIKPT